MSILVTKEKHELNINEKPIDYYSNTNIHIHQLIYLYISLTYL